MIFPLERLFTARNCKGSSQNVDSLLYVENASDFLVNKYTTG